MKQNLRFYEGLVDFGGSGGRAGELSVRPSSRPGNFSSPPGRPGLSVRPSGVTLILPFDETKKNDFLGF